MTEPSPGELSRRFDEMRREMRDSFRDINARIDDIPNLAALASILEVRDVRIGTQDRRLDELTKALAAEVANRQAADREAEKENEIALMKMQERIDAGRKWLVGTIITAIGTLVGILAFVSSLGAPPT